MHSIFRKKLNAILSIEPTPKNSEALRKMSNGFINEIRLSGKNDNEEKAALLNCYRHLQILERNIILSKEENSYLFCGIDINEAVKNCVLACDTLLSGSDLVLTFKESDAACCVCCPKLVIKAVSVAVCALLSHCDDAFIEVSLKNISHSTVLSAECESDNQFLDDEFGTEEMAVLEKIARIHRGVCLYSRSKGKERITLSLSNSLSATGKSVKTPSYIDLLLDKGSQVYIDLSKIDEIHFS